MDDELIAWAKEFTKPPKPQGGSIGSSKASSLQRAADKLGVDAADLGSIISFESAGSFNPHKVGGEGNKYKGLIQFGPEEQKRYYNPKDTFDTQVEDGVVRYFQDRFKQVGKDTRGATLEDLYTTVIAGNPKANRDAKDSFGTSARSGAQRILKEHRPKVIKDIFGGMDTYIPDDELWGKVDTALQTDEDVWGAVDQALGTRVEPVKELDTTISAQIQSANDPKVKTRFGVLATEPEQATLFANQPNFKPFETKEGTLWLNTAKIYADKKLKLKNEKDLAQYIAKNPKALTTLIGVAEDVGNETRGTAVRAKDPKTGIELATGVVTNPVSAVEQAQNYKDQFPDAVIEVTDTDTVTDERKNLASQVLDDPRQLGGEFAEPVMPHEAPHLDRVSVLAPQTKKAITPARGQKVPQNAQKPQETPVIEPSDGVDVISDDFTERITFRDKPKGVSNKEWFIQNLIPKIASRTGYDSAAIEKELRDSDFDTLGRGLVKGTPLSDISSDQFYDFVMTPGMSDAMANRSAQGYATEQAKIKADADFEERKKTIGPSLSGADRDLEEFRLRGMADIDAGLITPEKQVEAYEKLKKDVETWKEDRGFLGLGNEEDWAKFYAGLSGIQQANQSEKRSTVRDTPATSAKQFFDKAYADMQKQYGSASNWVQTQKEFKKRFEKSPMTYLMKTGEAAVGGAMQAPFQGAASALKSIAIGSEAIDKAIGGDQREAKDRYSWKLAESLEQLAPDVDKDFNDSSAKMFGNVAGQVIIQTGLGMATGGALAPALFGAAQGAAEQYEQGTKEGLDGWTRLGKALAGGLIEAPDYFVFKGMLKGGNALNKISAVQSLKATVERGLIAKGVVAPVAEKMAVAAADGFVAELIAKGGFKELVGKGLQVAASKGKVGGLEALQEGTTRPLNDLWAYISYDRSPERWDKATSLQKSDFVEGVAGFFGGIVGASMADIHARMEGLSPAAQQQVIEQTEVMKDVLPPQTLADIKKAFQSAPKRTETLSPLVEEPKPTTEVKAEPEKKKVTPKPTEVEKEEVPAILTELERSDRVKDVVGFRRKKAVDIPVEKAVDNTSLDEKAFNKLGYSLPSGLQNRGVETLTPVGENRFDVQLKDGTVLPKVLIHKDIKSEPAIDNKTLLTPSTKIQIAYNGKMQEVDENFQSAAIRVNANLQAGEKGYVKDADGKIYEISTSSKKAKLMPDTLATSITKTPVAQKLDAVKELNKQKREALAEVEDEAKSLEAQGQVAEAKKLRDDITAEYNAKILEAKKGKAPIQEINDVPLTKAEAEILYQDDNGNYITQTKKGAYKIWKSGATHATLAGTVDLKENGLERAKQRLAQLSVSPKAKSETQQVTRTINGKTYVGEVYKRETTGKEFVRYTKINGQEGNTPLNDTWKPVSDPMAMAVGSDIINSKGDIDYEHARDVTGKIQRGDAAIRRLNSAGERGRVAGGKRNVEASVILATNERASEESGSRTHPVERQERVLEAYAKREGVWFDSKEFARQQQGYIGKGQEAYVHRADDKSVSKLVDYKKIDEQSTPQDFIDNRISAFNYIFPETAYELTGFTRDNNGDFRFVVKQPFVQNVVYTTPTERQVFMKSKGFEMVDKYGEEFANEFYHVRDLHEKNALKALDGTIYVIDAVVTAKPIGNFEIVDKSSRNAQSPPMAMALNASGESSASLEAMNRQASEKSQQLKRVVVDTRSGKEYPLIGVDAVDRQARDYESIEFRGGNRNGEVISQGAKVSRAYSPPMAKLPTKPTPQMEEVVDYDTGELATKAKYATEGSLVTLGNLEAYGLANQAIQAITGKTSHFYGMTLNPSNVAKFREEVGKFIKDAGFSPKERTAFNKFVKAIDAAAKTNPKETVRIVLLPDAIAEESAHEARMQTMASEAVEASQSKDWIDRTVKSSLFNQTNISKRYKGKQIQAIEFVDKLIAKNYDDLGIDPNEHADEIIDIIQDWADDFIATNGEVDWSYYEKLNEINAALTQRISEEKGGNTKDTGKQDAQRDEAQEARSDVRVKAESKPAVKLKSREPGKSGLPFDETKAEQAKEDGQKVAAISKLTGIEDYYTPQGNAETEANVDAILGEMTFDQAVTQAMTSTPSPEASRVLARDAERLVGVAEAYRQQGKGAEQMATLRRVGEIIGALKIRQIGAGREVEIQKMLRPLTPEAAVITAEYLYQMAFDKPLSEAQRETVYELAKENQRLLGELATAEMKLAEAERAIADIDNNVPEKKAFNHQEALLNKYKKRKPIILAELQKRFPSSPVFSPPMAMAVGNTEVIIDPKTAELLKEYAIGQILTDRSYEAVIRELQDISGVSDEQVKDIHATAADEVRGAKTPQSEEAKKRIKIRQEHYAEADKRSGKLDAKAIATARKSLAELQRKIDEQDLATVRKQPTNSEELKTLREKQKELRKELKNLRKANTQTVKGLSRYGQKALNKNPEDIELAIAVDLLSNDKPKSMESVILELQNTYGFAPPEAKGIAQDAKNLIKELKAEDARTRDIAKGISAEQREIINQKRAEQRASANRLNRFLNQVTENPGLIKRFNDDFRIKLVANWGTQIFNAVQVGTVATPAQILLDIGEIGLRKLGIKIGEETDVRVRDLLKPYGYMFSANRQIAEQALANFPDLYFEVHKGLLGDIPIEPLKLADTKTGLSKLAHQWFDANAKYNEFATKYSGAKMFEMHFRNSVIAASFDQAIRKQTDGKQTLESVMKDGKLREYITESIAKRAAKRAMDVTFASEIDDAVGKELKHIYDKLDHYLPILLNPITYARFMYSTSKQAVINPLMFGAMDSTKLGGEGYSTRSIAKGILAYSTLAMAGVILSAIGGDDDKWYTLYPLGKNGPIIDIRRSYPLAAYFYLAHNVLQKANDKPMDTDILGGLLSLETEYYQHGAPMEFLGSLADVARQKKGVGDVGESTARLLGGYLSGFTRAAKPLRDLWAQVDADERAYREDPEGAKDKFINELSRSIPGMIRLSGQKKQTDLDGKVLEQPFPIGRIFGVNVVHPDFTREAGTKATQWANRLWQKEYSKMTPDEKRAYTLRNQLKKAVRAGQMDFTSASTRIDKYVSEGRLSKASGARLKSELKLSPLEVKVKYEFGDNEKDIKILTNVWNRATDEEKRDIRKILRDKDNVSDATRKLFK